jgi:hypothetical protein
MKGLTDACAVAKGGLRDSVAIELLVARSGSPGGRSREHPYGDDAEAWGGGSRVGAAGISRGRTLRGSRR